MGTTLSLSNSYTTEYRGVYASGATTYGCPVGSSSLTLREPNACRLSFDKRLCSAISSGVLGGGPTSVALLTTPFAIRTGLSFSSILQIGENLNLFEPESSASPLSFRSHQTIVIGA